MTENWHTNLKNKNREDIITAAKELFVKQSFLTVNIKEICTLAGISRVTFYKHFQTMNELVFEVQIEILEDMTGFVRRAPSAGMNGKEMLSSMLKGWIDYASQHPGYIRFVLLFDLHYEAYGSTKELREQYEQFISREKERHFLLEALETGANDGSLKRDAEPVKTAQFIFTSMMALLQKMSLIPGSEQHSGLEEIKIADRFAGMLLQHLSVD
ncbi:TetR/AcrR family transcriptional regulator [Paenibacillus sp. PK3_47]|uniref:TetR/AcrR family transcriptional regulator n=1 Tax=Paenibacillus sp. PK3_47 TaxID=2072642 RepID=UPI00201DF3A9|nr:TetR/AcrR family transcriptional regulator [Paenibacillus sp. PK3_47]UQZ36813.1 TetR/AcrR family transcriptional regulator [Paenibacillus sp. PK3_47]